MDETPLYQQIAAHFRRQILSGRLSPGERLPPVRRLCADWGCTPGTVQKAYRELANQGLVSSKAGRGTQVASRIPAGRSRSLETLRTVNLVNRSEAFLLEAVSAGHSLEEIQSALDLAMDRWRAMDESAKKAAPEIVRFAGSHDMVVNGLAHHVFGRVIPDARLQITFLGSQGGLAALAQGKADLCGCHLFDAASGTYNLPFIARSMLAEKVMVVTLAQRHLGLIVSAGNPMGILALADLQRPEVHFVNRQAGSGTRVWLDNALQQAGIPTQAVTGYRDERLTHSDVARAVAEGQADVGLGLETAALAYGQDFLPLTQERYDLVLDAEQAQRPVLQQFIDWLQSPAAREFITHYKGYDASLTGQIQKF